MFTTSFPPTALDQEIENFVGAVPKLRGHLKLLQLGARLKRDEDVEMNAEWNAFSDNQKVYLRNEKNLIGNAWAQSRFLWNQSKYLKGSLLSACLSGIIQ